MENIRAIELIKTPKDILLGQLDSCLEELKKKTIYADFVDTLMEFQTKVYSFYEQYQLSQFRFYGDTSQSDLKSIFEHNQSILPELMVRQTELKKIVGNSPFMDFLKEEYGDNMYYDIKNANFSMSEKAQALMLKDNKICQEVVEFKSQSKVDWNGQEIAVSKLYSFSKDNNRSIRKKAFDSIAKYYTENKEFFYTKLIELIQIRNAFAQELGFESYVEYSLVKWNRIGYNYNDIGTYRDAVVSHFKEAHKELHQFKKRQLGLATITYYDNNYFQNGFPSLIEKKEATTIEKLKSVLSNLSSHWLSIYQSMLTANSIDYLDRPNKVNMGYATYVSTIDTPLIYSQFQNNDQDVRVLTHEFGHTLQMTLSNANNKKKYLMEGTLDTVEIFSHSMEMLCLQDASLFFGADAEKYAILNYSGHILQAMTCSLGDEFQEKIYKLESPTIASIQSIYKELQEKYTGNFFDSTENEYFKNGDRWMEIDHYFSSPFYLIDYSLAIINALNIYKLYKENPKKGIETWEQLALQLGNLNYKNIHHIIPELGSPFDENFVAQTAKFALEELNTLLKNYESIQTAS